LLQELVTEQPAAEYRVQLAKATAEMARFCVLPRAPPRPNSRPGGPWRSKRCWLGKLPGNPNTGAFSAWVTATWPVISTR
jgi:hypothetical protein